MSAVHVGFMIYPDTNILDLAGPSEVLAIAPDIEILLIWKVPTPVRVSQGWHVVPTNTFDDCPQLDVLCVPGGPGHVEVMEDESSLEFIRRQADETRYLTAVCTGALVLGAAGTLVGYKATTHWIAHHLLAEFSAIPVHDRVVVDHDRVTTGGITAGVDFGIRLLSLLQGEEAAREGELTVEYAPSPLFNAGNPENCTATVRAIVLERFERLRMRQNESTKVAVANLKR